MASLTRYDWDAHDQLLINAMKVRVERMRAANVYDEWMKVVTEKGFDLHPERDLAKAIDAASKLLGWSAAPSPVAMTEAAADLPRGGARKPVAVNPQEAEAREFIASYAGTWQFMLTLQAEFKAGKLRFTDRVIEVIINCKTRDAAYARTATLRSAATPQAAPATEGWYEIDGDVVKVQKAIHGSGNLYAKRLVVEGGSASWVYEAGLVRKCNDTNRLSVERAAEMGRLYGICMVCGATLTDEASIERGIGPICYGKLG